MSHKSPRGKKRKRTDNDNDNNSSSTDNLNHNTTDSLTFKRPKNKKSRKQSQTMSSLPSNHTNNSHHKSNHSSRHHSSKHNNNYHRDHNHHRHRHRSRSNSPNRYKHRDYNRNRNRNNNTEDWSADPFNITLTPRYRPKNIIKSAPINKNNNNNNNNKMNNFDENAAWQTAENEIDRQWYLHEQGEIDAEYNPFGGNDNTFTSRQHRKKQLQIEKKKANKKQSMLEKLKEKYAEKQEQFKKNIPRITQLERDNAKWEEQMLYRSGVIRQVNESDMLFDEEVEHKVHILVRDMKPPFLDGRRQFSTQLKPISVVKDSTSDMAVIARKGSHTLYKWRENRDKQKIRSREKWWEVGSKSKQGQVLGVIGTSEKNDMKIKQETVENDEEYDYKKASQYGNSMDKMNAKMSNFSKNRTIKEQREYLPIFAVRDELMQIIRDNQIIILVGQTGSGKTTQITQYLYEDGFADLEDKSIVCTQPRSVAAMSVAKRVSEETYSKLGELVGYSIRFEDCTSEKTKIKYCTDGVLLREALNPLTLEKYSVIIMDEAHERSLHTDILFGVLRDIVANRLDLKLIVTSATLDSDKFSNFFSGAPVYIVPGRTFKVDINWSKTVCDDPLDMAVKTVIKIHITKEMGDILVFMTGQEDITACCQLIAQRLTKASENNDTIAPLTILPIYSQLPADLQAKIFEATPDGSRKCIVSTNIAETSLTVDGIKYVVDCGYCKVKVYKPSMGMDQLCIVPISRANADQRKGRAGRTNSGEVFRLYTRLSYQIELLSATIPEIQRTNLGNVILLLKSLGVSNLLNFSFMDPPPQETLISSMYQLWILGALNSNGNLTELGNKMVLYPLDPPLSKQLIFSCKLGCSNEILTIVSMLSVPNIFFRPENKAKESDEAREKFFKPESDHLTLLNVYNEWKRKNYNSYWCKKHFIHIKTMRKVREIRAQLQDIMKNKKHIIKSSNGDFDIIRKAICSAYFQNACKLKGIGEYINMRKGIPCHLHPSSSLFGMGYNPQYVVYHELIMTKKEYMRNVTSVNGEWLCELGKMFFTIKSDHKQQQKQEIYKKEIMEQELKISNAKKEKEKVINQLKELARQNHKNNQNVFQIGRSKKNNNNNQIFNKYNNNFSNNNNNNNNNNDDNSDDDMINLANLKNKLKRNKR